MRELVVATTNKGKLAELRRMLSDRGMGVRGLDEFEGVAEAVEDGATFAENARKKACHYSGLLAALVLADDSGLEVDALDGAPGVYSARFAETADGVGRADQDQANNRKLLGLLSEVPAAKRTARFRCCLCLARAGQVLLEVDGVLEGRIAAEGLGDNGFGYDPIFVLDEQGPSVAQLSADAKNAVSHRGRALQCMLDHLEALIDETGTCSHSKECHGT